MICSHCAAEMPEISSYCPSCGQSVPGDSSWPRSGNLQESLLGGLAYITIIPAIIFLLVPNFKSNSFIRFHSWQSILFSVAAVIIGLGMRVIFAILSVVPFIGFLFPWLAAGLAFLAIVFLWAVLVVKAGQGEVYELPWLGQIAARLAG